MFSGFSWEHGYHRCPIARGRSVLSRLTRSCVLHCTTYSYAVQRAIPSARGCVTSPSPHHSAAGCRNVDRLAIGYASRLPLRSRLNLIRLALIRNPWSFGVGVSRPHCRYLYLHLLFHALQHGSRHTFAAHGMLPYRPDLRRVPWLRHRTYARLLSMRDPSTSELLRTL